MFTLEKPNFDKTAFIQNFEQHCYLPPLKLEDGKPDTFLETTFSITDTNRIDFCLKNENTQHDPTKIWRYAHFNSQAAFQQKRATMLAVLKKVDTNSSDATQLYKSAIQKLEEFIRLNYPKKLLWTACTTLGVNTRTRTWFEIRDYLEAMY